VEGSEWNCSRLGWCWHSHRLPILPSKPEWSKSHLERWNICMVLRKKINNHNKQGGHM